MQLSLFLITFPAFIFNYALPAAIELDPESSETKAEELSGLDDHGHQMEDGIKEKRCKELPQFDFYNNILGSAKQSFPLNLKRRDLHRAEVMHRCSACRRKAFCLMGVPCDWCEKECKEVKNYSPTANSNSKEIVALAPRINVENGLSENQERYYTVGSFGPGPKQTLLARLLNIPSNVNLDRLIVLAKNNAKTANSLPPHPVIIDTAHVFTINDGKPAEIDVELHNVKTDLDEPSKLTTKLNKELDAAIETKKNILQDSHLTPEEIDKIIEHAISHGNDPTIIVGAEEDENLYEDDNLGLARDFSESSIKKKWKKGKGKKHGFEDDEETPIGMSNLETLASDGNVGNTFNANTNFENNSPMREFDEGIPFVAKTQDDLESVNDDILESKFKKKKKKGHGGYGYGMYRENEEIEDEEVNMEDDKKELIGSPLREENEDEILESKFKKKKKGGKGHGKGYGMYRENEEMQDEQMDDMSSDDTKQLVGSTLKEGNEDDILESKFKKKKKGGTGYGHYRENENFGQDYEDVPNFRSNYENAAATKSLSNPAYEVPKQQFQEANQQYQGPPAYANSPQHEAYQQPQTDQANQDYNVISMPAKSLPKPVSDSHYAYPAPAQPAYSNYQQQSAPPAPVYQEPMKMQQQPSYAQISANQRPQLNPTYSQPATYQQEPQANYQVPSINQPPPPPPPSNPYPQMQPAYSPEPYQPAIQQQPSYGYPPSPMYNNQNYQDMVPIELEEEMPEYAPVQTDYVVGSAKQNPDTNNDQKEQEEPKLRENWFEQQYHKLRNWVEENVGLEKPEDTVNESTEEKHKAILDEFTSIIKNDLSEGKRLSESEDADLNKRIASLIKSENITAPRLADELTKMEDMVESNTDSIVNLENIDELRSRFKSNDEMIDEHTNIGDSVVGDRQINRWQMVNMTKDPKPVIPEVNKAPLVDPNVVDLKTIMSGLKSVPHMVLDGAQKVANIIRADGKDVTVGDAKQVPTAEEAEDKGNDTVGCSLEKDSGEETMYLQPPGYGYGYRESKNQDKVHLPTLDELFHPHSKKKSHELNQFEELLHPQESRSGGKDKPVTGLPKLIQDLEHLTLPPLPGLKPHHTHHPSTLPPQPQHDDPNIPFPIENNPNENPNFNSNIPTDNNPFFNNNPPNDPNFNPNYNPNLNPNQQFMEPPPPFIPPQGFPNEFQSRHAHGHSLHGGRHNIVGAQHMQNNPNNPNFRHDLGHFGKIVPAELHDLNIHSRDVSEQLKGSKMYFVGDGIQLPLHMNKHDDGTLHLSVDMHKLCKCNQTNCKNEPHFLDTKISSDQDVPNTLDDDDVNLGMAAPSSKELESSLKDKDIFKRSPDTQQKFNVYDEQFDEVLPIRNMHRENLENHINVFNEDVNRYYDNEISDKIPERKSNDEGDDDVVQQRVGLLTNVLSWMKDLVMEDVKK